MGEPTESLPKWFANRPDAGLEFRDATQVDAGEDGYSGYASTVLTVDSYGTAFAKGAFRKTLADRADRLPVLWQHNPDHPIGRHRQIKEDKTGLYVDAVIIDDGDAGTVALKRLRGGVPLGLSFGFQRVGQTRSAEDGETFDPANLKALGIKREDVEVIPQVKLWETSLVTFPANEKAAISAVRAADLPDLLDAIRAGTLTEEAADLVEQIVSAQSERAAAASEHCTPDRAQRDHDIAIAVALAQYQGLLSGVAA